LIGLKGFDPNQIGGAFSPAAKNQNMGLRGATTTKDLRSAENYAKYGKQAENYYSGGQGPI
jgi:hypothetical protein